MPDIALISKAIDFVEGHLTEPIAVADVAEAVSYSLYHFCRTFNQATHHTPYNYLMRRRLSEAARTLLRGDEKILDVALRYQFNNHETFSRAFKRMFAMQPSQLRREGRIDSRRLMPRLTWAHLELIDRGAYPRPLRVEKNAFKIAGVMTLVRNPWVGTRDLWLLLAQELECSGAGSSARDYCGLCFYPQGWEECGFLYMAGFVIQDMDPGDTALVVKAIPALGYARFIHKGPMSGLPLALDYIHSTWRPKSGTELLWSLVFERYGQDWPSAARQGSETEIYVPLR